MTYVQDDGKVTTAATSRPTIPPKDTEEWRVMHRLCDWLDIRPSEGLAWMDFIRAHPNGPPNRTRPRIKIVEPSPFTIEDDT